MPSLEEVIRKILSDNQWLSKVLIGGLLIVSLIGIPFAAGYFFRYGWQVRVKGRFELPAWERWDMLLRDGVLFLVVAFGYCLLPFLLAGLLGSLAKMLLGILGIYISWGVMSVVFLFAPALTVSALLRVQRANDLRTLLNYRAVIEPVWGNWPKLLLPAIALVGVNVVGLPVLTFSFFLGFAIFIAYVLLVIIGSELEA